MNILMLAPEPFFQPRGTPISVYFRLKALSDIGHKVTLVTYHVGDNVPINNVEICRIRNLFGIRKIKIGPSAAKVPMDILLLLKAFSRLMKKRFDLIFTHEEASLLGILLGKLWKVPHLYDMHSSLPQQLENFSFSRFPLLKAAFRWMEQLILNNANSVIVICQDLLNHVERSGCGEKATLLENFIDFPSPEFSEAEVRKKRDEYAPKGEKIILYAGNFQPYQGIPLLLEAASQLDDRAIVLLVGGSDSEQEEMKKKVIDLKIQDKVVFVDRVPPSRVPLFMAIADVLVSPRITGTNTPLKIYSFLRSGKPLVATNLWTHTQVLHPGIAVLTEPNPSSFAHGISFALFDDKAKEIAAAAKELAEKEYTYSVYQEKLSESLEKALANFQSEG